MYKKGVGAEVAPHPGGNLICGGGKKGRVRVCGRERGADTLSATLSLSWEDGFMEQQFKKAFCALVLPRKN